MVSFLCVTRNILRISGPEDSLRHPRQFECVQECVRVLREPAEEMMPPLPLPNRWLISQKEELGRNRATERIVFVLGELRAANFLMQPDFAYRDSGLKGGEEPSRLRALAEGFELAGFFFEVVEFEQGRRLLFEQFLVLRLHRLDDLQRRFRGGGGLGVEIQGEGEKRGRREGEGEEGFHGYFPRLTKMRARRTFSAMVASFASILV